MALPLRYNITNNLYITSILNKHTDRKKDRESKESGAVKNRAKIIVWPKVILYFYSSRMTLVYRQLCGFASRGLRIRPAHLDPDLNPEEIIGP